ncbi:HU-CCDC81 and SPOR domain-containing protein [Aquimarina sp. TRL1]|uniref:HU domain-containing protein n=1 Tax=Aquimarina sp. (strain TRL1) TaxID=2736252 RepID=UPI00158A02DE|nr:SPOR domain-containing protein [Aquimarina sp. TRL1]QKX04750.1 HU-CCDC81 and SPOR domain-containing protein [Aquimarina sp. TRL1]
MNTATYISELLYRYECVIIPDFGAFLTKRESASIHSATNAFYPPKKLISFNRQLQNNDGLLANYIASAEQISYTDAISKIQRYVASLKNELTNGKRVSIEGIGSFFVSIEDTLQFEPFEQHNYLTEAFGLSSFVSPTIQREIYKEETESLEEKAPIAFTPEKRRERPYLKYAAVLAIAIGVSGFFGVKKYNDQTITYNDNEHKEATETIKQRIQEATFEISSPLPAISLSTLKEEAPSKAHKYHIVAGAFRFIDNANKKIEELQEKGFSPRLIGINQFGLHQVSYVSFSTRQEALTALQEIKNTNDKRAWLLVKELP